MLARNIVKLLSWRSILFRTISQYPGPLEFGYHLLDEKNGAKTDFSITKEESIQYFKDMAFLRRMELVIGNLYSKQEIRGFCHLYTGQEAIAVAICNRMRPTDTAITSYRCHGYCYLMGDRDVSGVIAELMGSKAGCSMGKGGSMHIYANRFYGGNGIVGAQVPLGTGLGFAHKYSENQGISFTIFGDGASDQGQVFEAFNIAKLWNLPIVYVIENNLYSMGTSTSRHSASPDHYRSCSYMPGILVDGMDIRATLNAVDFVIKYVSEGNGPIIMEMRTYRYFGHSVSDPGSSYRSRGEVEEIRKNRDPMKRLRKLIIDMNYATNEELNVIKKSILVEIKEAVRSIRKHGELDVEHVSSNIVSQSDQDDIRGVTILRPLKHQNIPPPK